jgi:hypothetical protein
LVGKIGSLFASNAAACVLPALPSISNWSGEVTMFGLSPLGSRPEFPGQAAAPR